jgi:GABA(A) receptor-associated protein
MSERKTVLDLTKEHFTTEEKELLRKEVDLIRHKYPHYIPIVVRTKNNSLQLKKCKFLVTGDITVGQFIYIIRKRLEQKLHSSHSLYLFINNTVPTASHLLSMVYSAQVDKETGMLFCTVCQEHTFGSF